MNAPTSAVWLYHEQVTRTYNLDTPAPRFARYGARFNPFPYRDRFCETLQFTDRFLQKLRAARFRSPLVMDLALVDKRLLNHVTMRRMTNAIDVHVLKEARQMDAVRLRSCSTKPELTARLCTHEQHAHVGFSRTPIAPTHEDAC